MNYDTEGDNRKNSARYVLSAAGARCETSKNIHGTAPALYHTHLRGHLSGAPNDTREVLDKPPIPQKRDVGENSTERVTEIIAKTVFAPNAVPGLFC